MKCPLCILPGGTLPGRSRGQEGGLGLCSQGRLSHLRHGWGLDAGSGWAWMSWGPGLGRGQGVRPATEGCSKSHGTWDHRGPVLAAGISCSCPEHLKEQRPQAASVSLSPALSLLNKAPALFPHWASNSGWQNTAMLFCSYYIYVHPYLPFVISDIGFPFPIMVYSIVSFAQKQV